MVELTDLHDATVHADTSIRSKSANQQSQNTTRPNASGVNDKCGDQRWLDADEQLVPVPSRPETDVPFHSEGYPDWWGMPREESCGDPDVCPESSSSRDAV